MNQPLTDKAQNNPDLHGNAPDKSHLAVVLLDVINDFNFPDGPELLQEAMQVVGNLRRLIALAHQAKVPVLYVNDNFGRWRSDFNAVVEHCLSGKAKGQDFVRQLQPTTDDYFVLKPKNSGFFGTTLELLLEYLHAHTLIVAGLTGDMCVQFTVQDAYLRDFKILVPADCVASSSRAANDQALDYMRKIHKSNVCPLASTNFDELVESCRVKQ